MNKELELIHLSTYLPYKLKCKITDEEINHTEIFDLIGVEKCPIDDYNMALVIDDEYYSHKITLSNVFPILRPLSDLIKEVEIDGKKIIPLFELAKLEYPNYKKLISLDGKPETDYHYSIQLKTNNDMIIKMSIGSYNKNGIDSILDMDCYGSDGKVSKMFSRSYLQQLIIRWHFDIYCLIENKLAIDINTLKK